jgi:hypothetical protein
LGILDQLLQLDSVVQKNLSGKTDNYPIDEEAEAEKEAKGKEKVEEEKFCNHPANSFQSLYGFLNFEAFVAYSTSLNQHPFREAEVHPPDTLFT